MGEKTGLTSGNVIKSKCPICLGAGVLVEIHNQVRAEHYRHMVVDLSQNPALYEHQVAHLPLCWACDGMGWIRVMAKGENHGSDTAGDRGGC